MRRTFAALLAVCAALILAAGCAGENEYVIAHRLYTQLQQYDEALKHAEEAVRLNPGSEKYQALVADIKTSVARAEYKKGLQYRDRGQLSQALLAFDKAMKYDPHFEEARREYEAVSSRGISLKAKLSAIRKLTAAGRPDEALVLIKEVEPFVRDFPEVRGLKTRAEQASTILHTKRGNLALHDGDFEQARKEFEIARSRTAGYEPAIEGLRKALSQIKAARLTAEGTALLEEKQYARAHAKFEEAMLAVPGHPGARDALLETRRLWARALYEQGRLLEAKGDFESMAEALRNYERAGSLTERFNELDNRIEALKKALAGEFLRRGRQYQELGADYLGLALVNYQMSLYCDPTQVELSREVISLKEMFDNRRAFYIDIRLTNDSSATASYFGRQLTQALKRAVVSSGIKDLYLVAPFDRDEPASSGAPLEGLAGRHMTIFVTSVGEDAVVKDEDKPEVVRSTYRLGSREVQNPAYQQARQSLAAAEAQETRVRQDILRLRRDLETATTPEEEESIRAQILDEQLRLEDSLDSTSEANTALANTVQFLQEDVTQPYDYLVYTVTMEAKVEVGLEVADPQRRAVTELESIAGTAEASDTYNQGVEATDTTGTEFDPRELPTKSELVAGARADAAEKAVNWLKESLLADLAKRYYEKALEQQEAGNIEGAAEYFYAFYLSAVDKSTAEAQQAISYVRNQTHLLTADERKPATTRMPR